MATEPQLDSQSEPNAPLNEAELPHAALFRDIQEEWNKAEEAIKRCEQIALDVAIPAIAELRYAGRRIVDALTLARTPGNHGAKVLAHLEDARFCCHRAQHDAVDAALSKIAIDLDDLTRRLGFEPVAKAYPAFQEFYAEFAHTRSKIAASRAKREDRNAIYEAVTAVDLPAIIVRYEQIMIVRPVAKRFARQRVLGTFVGLFLAIVAVATMIFAAMAVDWGKWLPSDPPAKSGQKKA